VALNIAVNAANLLQYINVSLHGFRGGRLGSLTVDQARQAIANRLASGGLQSLQTHVNVQGLIEFQGQVTVAGSTYGTYGFSGAIVDGVYRVSTVYLPH